ncbi:MAG: efflux RND transporter periplasmic adaptor subunit [Phycisphaerales bacterium JB043]
MSRANQRARGVLAWVWKHTSAGVAIVLITVALVIGYRLGRAIPKPEPQIALTDGDARVGEQPMYTCSMHPSVRLPDPNAKCPICFMDLIPVAGHSGESSELRVVMSESAVAMSRIETAPVARFFPVAETRLYGKVTYDETSVARLTAYFPGRIERLFANFVGIHVAEGDHIAEVYSPDLLAAFEELYQAAQSSGDSADMSEIVRDATRNTLAAARDKLRLYGLTPEQITAVERGEHDSDSLTVYAPIGGIVTHITVREGDYIDEGTPIATVANLSRLWLDLEAYESQLPLLHWGQRVSFTVEAHPGEVFEGRISFIEPIIDEQMRTAAVRVAVDNSGARLKPGMFASAVVEPRMAEGGAIVSDELAGRWVSPMHPTIVKDAPGECDICGMELVSAEALGVVSDPSTYQEPLVVPRSAVLFTGARSVVYVAVPDAEKPTYEGREVLLGPRAGEFYLVREGLREGELVVVNGAFRIDSAMQIAAKPSMMSPGGGSTDAHAGHGAPRGVENTQPARAGVSDTFVRGLDPVYAAYLDAQEALASDDLGRFVQAASDLKTAIGSVEETGLVGEPLASWRDAESHLRIEDPVTDIELARARFESMSNAVIALQKRFGHSADETWHVAYCPMAFNDTGAEWLQRGTQINNPYFGASMLHCGEIRGQFPPLNTELPSEHEHEDHDDE